MTAPATGQQSIPAQSSSWWPSAVVRDRVIDWSLAARRSIAMLREFAGSVEEFSFHVLWPLPVCAPIYIIQRQLFNINTQSLKTVQIFLFDCYTKHDWWFPANYCDINPLYYFDINPGSDINPLYHLQYGAIHCLMVGLEFACRQRGMEQRESQGQRVQQRGDMQRCTWV